MTTEKTSLLINRQLPEFIREEYPLFQSFLEAYFEFLENKQGSEKNDLTTKAKELRTISDVDESLVDFENNFLETYAQFFPKNTSVTKELLLKNVMPFYLSKGSEKSFKFLFRSLFNQEIEFKRISDNIIRASDGDWIKENKLRIDKEFRLYYKVAGTKTVFDLLFATPANKVRVYVNEILQNSLTYFVQPEALKLTFYTAPANGSVVEIFYDDYSLFDPTKLFSRTVTGLSSGASIVTEKVVEERINELQIFSLFAEEKNILGSFAEGETVEFTAFNDKDIKITIRAQTISILRSINIIDGGSNYKVGDPVKIIGGQSGNFIIPPSAIINEVFSGLISRINVLYGGAGFVLGDTVEPLNISNVALSLAIDQVNTGGELTSTLTANTFKIYTDIISDIDPANTLISASNYGFPSTLITAGENVNTIIAQALSNSSFTSIGPIQSVAILSSNSSFSATPIIDATPAQLTVANGSISIRDFGTLGRFQINNGGQNYAVGDEVIFTNPPMGFGIGAAATVGEVDINGSITLLKFQPYRVSGLVGVTTGSSIVGGNANTKFETELVVGDTIRVNNQDRKVTTITSNTTLLVDSNFTANASNVRLGKLDVYPIGGQGYKNTKLPTLTINSANGTNANVVTTTIFGDGENLEPTGTKKPGEILSIVLLNPGRGFVQNPTIDLSGFGDGNATANATIENPISILPGRFFTSKGIISAEEMRIQSGNYYHNYSYTISAGIEFNRYKSVIRNLIHPSGYQDHGEWTKLETLNTATSSINNASNILTTRVLSGKVNVANNSAFVIGTGTKFVTANNLELITIGAYITVNSQIRVVDSIISNTNLKVTSAFTITANNQELVVINTAYESIATEVSLDEIIAENELVLTVES
jgi:hypothetical protein